MPCVFLILIFVVSSLTRKSYFGGSMLLDFFIRIIICLWFCVGYIRLSKVKNTYRLYPNLRWEKDNVSEKGKILYISLAILFGIGIGLVTYWVFRVFVPILGNIIFFLAIANGIIYAIPLIRQYEVFKL
jgi:hypothetical protein